MYRQMSVVFPNTKFHKKPSGVSRVVLFGRTDRRDEVSGHFSQNAL
jgi:hypothetical protein